MESTRVGDRIKRNAILNARDSFTRRLLIGLLLLVLLSLLALGWATLTTYQEGKDTQRILKETSQASETNKEAAEDLSKQVEKSGEDPVVDVDKLPDVPTEAKVGDTLQRGLTGPPFPRPEAESILQTMVNSYCADDACRGENAPKLTATQRAQDVATYCAPRNECRGMNGESITGAAGSNGQDAPSITNIECDGSTGVFTFSNDSVIEVADMCTAPLIP